MVDAFAGASDTILDDIALGLDFLEPDEETKLRSKYARIHPNVASAVARGIPQRQILELLKAKGFDFHHATFAKLFRTEQVVRDEQGERICCVTCGQLLVAKDSGHTEPSDRADAIGIVEEVTP